jgi:hypothetical protein
MMNKTLSKVNEHVMQFQTGGISIGEMWERIESHLDGIINSKNDIDRFEDDKAERRIPRSALEKS